ncbi:hypothetical protein [Mycolicibacterium peregrinum]|uniref:hypothetical protein n=1 Tax=Mycolicibacterium peregrinum TaxID=43304 RepID=UPI003AAB25B9
MSDMLEVMSMMAAPAAMLLMLRGYVIRQNRIADTAESTAAPVDPINPTSGRATRGTPARGCCYYEGA